MKAQQFAMAKRVLQWRTWLKIRLGGQRGGVCTLRAIQPRVLGVTIVLSASQNILPCYLFLVKLGDAQAGWDQDHLLGQISAGGWRNGICRLNGALDLHRFKSI